VAEFGKRGLALKQTAAPNRKTAEATPRLGRGLWITVVALFFVGVLVSLTAATHVFFTSAFCMICAMFGFGAGESLRALRATFAAGKLGWGILCIVETLGCGALFGVYLLALYYLTANTRDGGAVLFYFLAATGVVTTIYLQTPHYEHRLRVRSQDVG
jgi:hypothetical protein